MQLIKAKTESQTDSKIAKVGELIATLQGQESSARASLEQAQSQFQEIQDQIAEANRQLTELREKQELERKGAEFNKAVRQVHLLAEEFNHHAIELIRLLKKMQALDPRREIVFGPIDRNIHCSLPVAIFRENIPVVRILPGSELHHWKGKAFDDQQIQQLLEELAK